MLKKLLLLIATVATISSSEVYANYYACGGFNGWNAAEAQEFTKDADGTYRLSINFAQSTSFKISTVKPGPGNIQAQWAAFDNGSINPVATPQMYEPVSFAAGTENIEAPQGKTLTVVINEELSQMAFTDGRDIQWAFDPTPDPTPVGNANFYLCGSFCGWNPSASVQMHIGSGGLYYADVDFSSGVFFKMSTVRPAAGDTNQMWSEFDQHSQQINGISQMYKGISYEPGVDNSEAPSATELTVVVDPNLKKIAFTDGNKEINWNVTSVGVAQPSGTLPVIYINTEGNEPIVSKEYYLKGTYYLDPNGVEGVDAVGSVDAPLPLQVKGRGNYTWTGFDKKPYRLKLDKKASLVGMKKSKHYALLAHADDNHAFLRNHVGFEVARRIGLDWTSADEPVEVVINGEYKGLYFLTETIRVDGDRVNVFEQPDGEASTNVTGGWLVELDNYDSDPHVEFRSAVDGYRLIFTYKTPEVLTSEQSTWLYNQMKAIDTAIASKDKSKATWLDYIDVESLAKFYIVQEVMDNYESFSGSCYLHRDVDDATLSVDGLDNHKWKFGPVWDFGSVFFDEKTQYCYQGRPHHMAWIGEMCKFPQFMDVVKQQWREFYPAKYGDMDSYIQEHCDRIETAAANDLARWPSYGNKDIQWHASDVKRRMNSSTAWLVQQWGQGSDSALDAVDTDAADQAKSIEVEVAHGAVQVYARQAQSLKVTRIDGTYTVVPLQKGANTLNLPAGVYIIEGRKVLL